jgi:hypothetical protein
MLTVATVVTGAGATVVDDASVGIAGTTELVAGSVDGVEVVVPIMGSTVVVVAAEATGIVAAGSKAVVVGMKEPRPRRLFGGRRSSRVSSSGLKRLPNSLGAAASCAARRAFLRENHWRSSLRTDIVRTSASKMTRTIDGESTVRRRAGSAAGLLACR